MIELVMRRTRTPRTKLGLAAAVGLAALAAACGNAPGTADAANGARGGSSPSVALAGSTALLDEAFPRASAGDGRDAAALQQEIDDDRRTAIVRAAERVSPAVVSVSVIRRETVQPRTLWEGFFLPPGYQREVQGIGSGFILRDDGLVLTNEHVVRGASEVVVTLGDGREFEAEIVGMDELTDLALLRIDASGELPVAPLGDSDDLLIGEWLIAIGNPLGYLLSNTEPTITAGVVSGIDRHIIPGDEGRGYYLDMIQTDASINPGNSGGALANARGEVVGVNSSIISRSGGSEGLGFAIPINRARRIAFDLLDDGRVRRAWVGVELGSGPAGQAGASGRSSPSAQSGQVGQPATPRGGRAVRIAAVAPGSPAADAGLEPGMVLREVGGRSIRTPLDWESAMLDAVVGEPLSVVVEDAGGERTLRVTPSDLPSLTADRVRALLDFELVTLNEAIRAERGLRSPEGALIVSLSEAVQRELGLRAGDLIVQINNTRIRTAEDAAQLLSRLAGGGSIRLVYERRGRLMSTFFSIR